MHLATGGPQMQKAIADAGAIKLLVYLLKEGSDATKERCSRALAALSDNACVANQAAIEANDGVAVLVGLLDAARVDAVRAHAATAIEKLSEGNAKNQERVAAVGGIRALVALLQTGMGADEHTKRSAAAALRAVSAKHSQNQEAVAVAGGIAPLVDLLGVGGVHSQKQATATLAALALGSQPNCQSVAKLLTALLGSSEPSVTAKAARAIANLASAASRANQVALSEAGSIDLLVQLLRSRRQGEAPRTLDTEVASALWSMCDSNESNQSKIASAGGAASLIALLDEAGGTESHRAGAGALWSLAENHEHNQTAIAASANGIDRLVWLLRTGAPVAQETATGTIKALAALPANRTLIAEAGGIPLLIKLLGSSMASCVAQATGALKRLVLEPACASHIAQGLVRLLAGGGERAAPQHATQLLHSLAQDTDSLNAIIEAGAVPQLVGQLKQATGPTASLELAASTLSRIALNSEPHKTVSDAKQASASTLPLLHCPSECHDLKFSTLHPLISRPTPFVQVNPRPSQACSSKCFE